MEKDNAWFSSQKRWHAPWTEDLLIHRQPGGVGRLGAPVKETPRNLFFLYCLFTFKKPSFYMKKNPPTSVPNFNTLVKDLVHKDLLTGVWTLGVSPASRIKTWRVSPLFVSFAAKSKGDMTSVECHADPNIGKATGTERTVAAFRESQSTSRGPHRNRFLAVQAEIRVRMQCVHKTLLAEAAIEKNRKKWKAPKYSM